MRNFANTGTRNTVADVITIEGMAQSNLKKREAMRQRQANNTPVHPSYKGFPFHYNETLLCQINELAKDRGSSGVPYPYAKMPPPDNGYRFLWEAHSDNVSRRLAYPPMVESERCSCPLCGGNELPLPHDIDGKIAQQPEVDANANVANVDADVEVDDDVEVINEDVGVMVEKGAITPVAAKQQALDNTTQKNADAALFARPTTAFPFAYPPPWYQGASMAPNFGMGMVPNSAIDLTRMMAIPQPPDELSFCCGKYKEYLSKELKRSGRPPHDSDCPTRLASKEKYNDTKNNSNSEECI